MQARREGSESFSSGFTRVRRTLSLYATRNIKFNNIYIYIYVVFVYLFRGVLLVFIDRVV